MIIRSLSWLLVGGLAVSPSAAAGPPQRPNVLFLFADDQRYDTIAALGYSVIRTPNLDRLVQRGLVFQRAYMQGGMQPATCMPSRAMLLAGQSLFRIDEKLRRDPTWPAAFAKAGYVTFMTGKWHNDDASVSASFPNARAVFFDGMADPLKVRVRHVKAGQLQPLEPLDQHSCAAFADEAIRFLKTHKDGPFLCYVAFNTPHDPHIVPETFPVRYAADQMPLPANFMPLHPFDNGEMSIRDEKLLPWPRSRQAVQQMLADYYRAISYLDAQIGRILNALDESPHARRTLVVFTADSGVARGSHGLIGKQNLYEHSVRVPLILTGPGIPAGRTTQAMCYLSDVFPTLGRLCDVPAPATSDGLEFTAVLRDPRRSARPHLLFAYRNVQRAIRDERWKLIRYPQVDRTQLFDLETDPEETVNLASKPDQANRIKALRQLLEKEQAHLQDKQPWNSPEPKSAEWKPPTQ